MTNPEAQGNQAKPGAKSRSGEPLADEPQLDSIRLTCPESDCCFASEAPSGGVPAEPVAEHYVSPQSSTSTGSKQFTERAVANDYKEELVTHSLKTLVADLLKTGRGEEAEIGSRVLVDLSERKITVGEAQEILELLQAHKTDNASRRYAAHFGRGKSRSLIVLGVTVAASMLLLLVGGMIAAPNRNTVATPPAVSNQLPYKYQFLPVSTEKDLRSLRGTDTATFTVTNRLNKTVSVYWLNYQGVRTLYGTLAPGQSLGQQSFITHPWVVVDDQGKPIMLFLPGTEPNKQIDIR